MFSSLAAGLIFGLSAGLAPGPLLTLVIAQTLQHNMKEGIKVALSPLVTDLPIIALSLFIVARLSNFTLILGLISLIGGLYVMYLALESIRFSPAQQTMDTIQPQSLKKGALINTLNPHPYLFWTTVGAPLIVKHHNEHAYAPAAVFILSFYVLLVGSKALLAVIAGRFQLFLSGKVYSYIMRFLGCMLALFALVLFRDAFLFLVIR